MKWDEPFHAQKTLKCCLKSSIQFLWFKNSKEIQTPRYAINTFWSAYLSISLSRFLFPIISRNDTCYSVGFIRDRKWKNAHMYVHSDSSHHAGTGRVPPIAIISPVLHGGMFFQCLIDPPITRAALTSRSYSGQSVRVGRNLFATWPRLAPSFRRGKINGLHLRSVCERQERRTLRETRW